MRFRDQNIGLVYVYDAYKQVRTCYEKLGEPVPQNIDLKSYMIDLFYQKKHSVIFVFIFG